MASRTPPPDPLRSSHFQSSQSAGEIIIDRNIPKDIAEVLDELSHQRALHFDKLHHFSSEQATAFKKLESALMDYEFRFLEMKKAYLEYQKDQKNQKSQQKFSQLYEQLDTLGVELTKTYASLGMISDHFDLLLNREHSYADFICTKERILNPILNNLLFFQQLHAFFQTNQERVISEFQKAGILQSGLPALEKIDLEYVNEGDETHHFGKKPVVVTFIFSKGMSFKFVCKPRDALLDQKVIELFRQINQLPPSQKSSTHDLPTYTILSPSKETSWEMIEDLGPISLWEFIDGKHPSHKQSAHSFIDQDVSKEKQAVLYQKLNHLDAILTQLSISDLTFANIFFVALDSDHPEIVPIDLENIQWGKPTQLKGHPEQVHLKPQELQLISELKEKIPSLIIRILPLGTQDLLVFGSTHKTNEDLTTRSTQNLGSQGYTIFQEELLKKLLLKDILNSDVPYLTELQKVLYYGLPSQGVRIGERK